MYNTFCYFTGSQDTTVVADYLAVDLANLDICTPCIGKFRNSPS